MNGRGRANLRRSPLQGRRFAMILYGSSLSPFARKVLAYTAEKGIELDLQPTGFPNHSPEYLEASPFRKMPPMLDYLERTVPDEGGYLVGDRLTLADLAVASPFVNFRHTGSPIDAARYPRTVAYVDSILERPSFKQWVDRETAFLAKQAA